MIKWIILGAILLLIFGLGGLFHIFKRALLLAIVVVIAFFLKNYFVPRLFNLDDLTFDNFFNFVGFIRVFTIK